jgi:hypothetical protein
MSRRWSVERVAVVAGAFFLLVVLGLALLPEPAPVTPAPEAQQLERSASASPAASAPPAGSPTRTSIPIDTPYPTAMYPIVSSDPPLALTRRGDVMLRLQPQATQAMPGEIISATLRVTNIGSQPITVTYASAQLFGTPDLPESAWHGPLENREWGQVVQPGEGYAASVAVLIPQSIAPGAGYELWGMVEVALPGDEWASIAIETGPVELVAVLGGRALYPALEVRDEGWEVRQLGPRQEHQRAWGILETNYEDGTTSYQWFGDDTTGPWRGTWEGRSAPVSARVLLTAPGYVATVVSATLPGRTPPDPQQQVPTFSSLDEASAYAGFEPPQLAELSGTRLESVQVISSTAGGPEPINITTILTYRTVEGNWIQLSQHHYGGSFFIGDSQTIKVGEVSGQASRSLGRWIVQWHHKGYTTVLTAPVDAFSLEELIKLAESVR